MAKYQERLDRLEQVLSEDGGGVFVVMVPDGESEDGALRDAMAKVGLVKRPRYPIFITPLDALI